MNPHIKEILLSRKIGDKVLRALQRFIDNDLYLLRINANERSLSHCLAIYLQEEFPAFNVDCEYNRDGIDPKRLPQLDLYQDS